MHDTSPHDTHDTPTISEAWASIHIAPVPLLAGSDQRLTVTALRLIILTAGYTDHTTGWCSLKQREYGALAHRNRNTVGYTLARLQSLGYLEASHNLYNPQERRMARTVYRVVYRHAAPDVSPDAAPVQSSPDATGTLATCTPAPQGKAGEQIETRRTDHRNTPPAYRNAM